MDVSWEAVGAFGEIVGAAIVGVTLIVLIVQLRQNTVEVRANTVQSLLDSSTALFGETVSSPIPEIVARLNAGEELSAPDTIRHYMFVRRNFQLFEQVFLQHRDGRVSDEIMDAYRARIVSHFTGPQWTSQWERIKPLVTRSFAAYVDARQDEASARRAEIP